MEISVNNEESEESLALIDEKSDKSIEDAEMMQIKEVARQMYDSSLQVMHNIRAASKRGFRRKIDEQSILLRPSPKNLPRLGSLNVNVEKVSKINLSRLSAVEKSLPL